MESTTELKNGHPSESSLEGVLRRYHNVDEYRDLHWEGSFEEYLALVRQNPKVIRNAYQRVYDMIMEHGTEDYMDSKKRMVRYHFFNAKQFGGDDAVFGLDIPLMRLVNFFKSAAMGYGTERRVLLLHGPVGSAKSTIARLLKRGLEAYSRTPQGALYTYEWHIPREDQKDLFPSGMEIMPSPMHEEPLTLIPKDIRVQVLRDLGIEVDLRINLKQDPSPPCRYVFNELMERYHGDLSKVFSHIRVKRLLLSEQDRVGIGTFQPKDEKNQDSTELTGDINYRKIAIYGSDSDPRAFNFDGEFNIANRGIIEFIEMLKLDVAFLYDLLGASQEHRIKPKKFAQTDIDLVIIGHSVAGEEPIPYRWDGLIRWATLEQLHERFSTDPTGLEVLAYNFDKQHVAWTPVKSVFRHRFTGKMLTTSQTWGSVETTPNHSIYNRQGQCFYPEENIQESRHEMMALRGFDQAFGESSLTIVDIAQGIEGLLDHTATKTSTGEGITKPCPVDYVRLDHSSDATAIRSRYDLRQDADANAMRDLLTALIGYATESHLDGNDSLPLGGETFAKIAAVHCGEGSAFKRLPDFLFNLPQPFLRYAFDELLRTEGSGKQSALLQQTASDARKERSCEYNTRSPMLAAQVGTLATLLGMDYSISRTEGEQGSPVYRVRLVSGDDKQGSRPSSAETRVTPRSVSDIWVYDIECIGLHNFVCGVGNIVCHNTNEAEYKKLLNNEFMEALRDRTIKIDIPYVTRLSEEVRIYRRDFNKHKIRGKDIAPHTLEMAAMWAVLTRLEDPKKANLSLLQKMKLYDGKSLPGYTEDNVKELRKDATREGMEGISPRYVQDKISNTLVTEKNQGSINPFMVLNEISSGLRSHSLITNDEQRKRYLEMLDVVKQEYEDVVKNEVQRAISADEEAIAKLCANYIDNVKAYTQRERVKNPYTGQYEEPDERLMRSIEEKIDVAPARKDDFRREIMNYIGALAVEGKIFDYRTNERLHKALELKLFEDQKDTIRLTSLVSNVIDKDTQEKIDIVKTRLIRDYGYSEESATDVLNFVASIFARGDVKKD